MIDSEETDPSQDFSAKDYIPDVPEARIPNEEEQQQRNRKHRSKQHRPVTVGVDRNLTKIDSKIPQDTLDIEKSKVGDIKVEPGSFNFM